MDLSEILSITGKSDLHKLVSQMKNGIVVESLVSGKRFPTFSHDKISSLEEISIYTELEDVPLKEVFKAIFEKLEGGAIEGVKTNDELKVFMASVLPDYDKERVYVSHIKKIVNWYNQLQKKGLLDFSEETAEDASDETENKDEKA